MTNEALMAAHEDAPTDVMSTQEIMAYLTDEERSRFVMLQELFESSGWQLMREHAAAMATYQAVSGANAKSWDECLIARGSRTTWEKVANLATEFMNAFESAAAAAKAEANAGSDPEDFN